MKRRMSYSEERIIRHNKGKRPLQLYHDRNRQVAEAFSFHVGIKAAELRAGRDREPDHGE